MVVRITKPPAKTPEAPKPATALPAIIAPDVGAAPETRLPISKITTKAM